MILNQIIKENPYDFKKFFKQKKFQFFFKNNFYKKNM